MIRGVSEVAILKAVKTGRLLAVALSERGLMLSKEQVSGGVFSEREWRKLCDQYVSVPDACEIVHKTDAAVHRDLRDGVIDGFRLNGKAWAVRRSSAEQEFRDYLARAASTPGRKRDLGEAKSPRAIRRKKRKTR